MDVTKQAASAARQDWRFSAVKIGELMMLHSFTASRLLLFYFILNNTQDNRYREHYR